MTLCIRGTQNVLYISKACHFIIFNQCEFTAGGPLAPVVRTKAESLHSRRPRRYPPAAWPPSDPRRLNAAAEESEHKKLGATPAGESDPNATKQTPQASEHRYFGGCSSDEAIQDQDLSPGRLESYRPYWDPCTYVVFWAPNLLRPTVDQQSERRALKISRVSHHVDADMGVPEKLGDFCVAPTRIARIMVSSRVRKPSNLCSHGTQTFTFRSTRSKQQAGLNALALCFGIWCLQTSSK